MLDPSLYPIVLEVYIIGAFLFAALDSFLRYRDGDNAASASILATGIIWPGTVVVYPALAIFYRLRRVCRRVFDGR